MTTAQAKNANAPVANSGKFPYPYRAAWALLLLLGNFLVAAYYFHILE